MMMNLLQLLNQHGLQPPTGFRSFYPTPGMPMQGPNQLPFPQAQNLPPIGGHPGFDPRMGGPGQYPTPIGQPQGPMQLQQGGMQPQRQQGYQNQGRSPMRGLMMPY